MQKTVNSTEFRFDCLCKGAGIESVVYVFDDRTDSAENLGRNYAGVAAGAL